MQNNKTIVFVLSVLSIMDVCACVTPISSHTDYNCSAEEVKQSGCLNNGVCFIVKLETREPSCHCPIEYTGKRCQELNLDLLIGSTEIAIIVSVVILLACLGAVSVYIWYRRRHHLPTVPCKGRSHSCSKVEEDIGTEGSMMMNGEETKSVEMLPLADPESDFALGTQPNKSTF